MKFTAFRDSYEDVYNGVTIKESIKEFETELIPLLNNGKERRCYVIFQGFFGKYKIRECIVTNIYFNGEWGYHMDNGWEILGDELGKTIFLYNELNKAIDICEVANRRRKVKVIRQNGL